MKRAAALGLLAFILLATVAQVQSSLEPQVQPRRHHRVSPRAAAEAREDSCTSAQRPWIKHTPKHTSICDSYADVADHTFDYVIVGGGTAGLALAGRLSEDEGVSVAVIEAGDAGYGVEKLAVPQDAYYDSAVGSSLDWSFSTASQVGLDGRTVAWPRGKALGGSSAINGLYYVVASEKEHDHLSDFVSTEKNLDWASLRRGLHKSQNYMGQPVAALQKATAFANETLAKGGPVCLSYPAHTYRAVRDWVANDTGVAPRAEAPYDGDNLGAFVAASTIDAQSWTRATSRTAYLDPISAERSGRLKVLPNQHVTRVLFSSSNEQQPPRATGVEFAASKDAPKVTVTAQREVILAAGAVSSPQILQLSGIGAADQLAKHNISTVKDLPGVGQHLQDHVSTKVSYKAKPDAHLPHRSENLHTASYVDGAIAYLSLPELLAYDETKITSFIDDARNTSQKHVVGSNNAVQTGYERTSSVLLDKLTWGTRPKGAVELLLGTMQPNHVIEVQVALQSPLSRGNVSLASPDPFDKPHIDAGYLSHASDLKLLVLGLQRALEAGSDSALAQRIESLIEGDVDPRSDAEAYIRKTAGTEYHPSSSCAMMDESLGGVVDGRFRVHGIDGLRVVDASVVPYALSSHLAAEVYALAEVAADLIKHDHRSAETGDGDEGGDEGDDDDDEDCDDGEDEGEDEEEECDDE